MKRLILGITCSLAMVVPGLAMDLTFSWGNIPKCTNGNPNRVNNPNFTLSNVPAGTKTLRFKLTDRNVPSYNHGGGTVEYSGNTIAPGAFKYKSPCPPNGSHTYQWSVTAKDAMGKSVATAKSSQKYP